ncbi:peptide chain release factor N(5)-glutamine methyltransferase [Virgibacillus sp. LDC-1]|uniref:peptide chain release factor N(5)-glutamine methyltransferase n=1 Tax=Virgibacillus sp. LDC-1 TaxID=3039856 RepID=UPI0024DE8B1A|nr:peptide chain release factor N(5)-glutamine methyltransferase [Virgibacillus sp. LDC-1]
MQNKWKQYEVLEWASLFLEKHHREPRVAELLLQHELQMTRSAFFANMRERITPKVKESFEAAIIQHAKTGVPVQHLIGKETFWGRDFQVNKDVLIPRPETEELVAFTISYVQEHFSNDATPRIVDVGTGSGVIATTLALELPNAQVFATDISTAALQVAEENAKQLHANVHFLQGDFLHPIIDQQGTVDIIISNPPYISRAEEPLLSDTVKDFDPEIALFADEEGLAAYKKIIKQVPHVMKESCMLSLEIGHEQGNAVSDMIKSQFPQSAPKVIQDINKKDRIVTALLSK